MVLTVIVGTGDLAYALAHLFHNNNSGNSGNFLEVTKAGITRIGGLFHETGVPLVPLEESLRRADIVILAIPAKALKTFVPNHITLLKDKVLVDCTNPSKKGEDLDNLVRSTGIRWVKAFNDLGAVDILTNKASGKKKFTTKMCSPCRIPLEITKAMAEKSFGLDVKVVPYERYREIANSQNKIGDEWVHAARIMIVIFLLTELYAVLRYNVFKGYAWFHLPIQVTNKAICWSAITGFSFTQLPGVLARIRNIVSRGKARRQPHWLKWALTIRKHLGLLSLWFLVLHILMSLLLFNPAYYGKFFIDPSAPTSKLNVIGETSFLFAVIGSMFYFILGISSLPSVGSNMNSRQWQIVYGPVAWSALAFGTIHVLIMGVKGWDNQETWPGGMPPITLTATLIPMCVIQLKVIEVVLSVAYGCCSNSSSQPQDDMHHIRTLIIAGSVLKGGHDSDDSENTSSVTSKALSSNYDMQEARASEVECGLEAENDLPDV